MYWFWLFWKFKGNQKKITKKKEKYYNPPLFFDDTTYLVLEGSMNIEKVKAAN